MTVSLALALSRSLTAILILIGFQLWMFGLVADLMAANRQLAEEVQLRIRRLEADSKTKNKS